MKLVKPCWTKEIHSIFFSKSRNSFRHFCVYLRLVPLLEKKRNFCALLEILIATLEKKYKNTSKKFFTFKLTEKNLFRRKSNIELPKSCQQFWWENILNPALTKKDTFTHHDDDEYILFEFLKVLPFFNWQASVFRHFVAVLPTRDFFLFFLWFCNFSLNLKGTISVSFERQKLNMNELQAQVIQYL